MATIKAIEGRSVHQIQSGQVIVDLNSVVKELVENSLDAGATSIDVRFRNHGLDAIEVQDNGGGISPDDFETVALKHYTSKLTHYDDLANLDTFGFRGEALSSLCALSHFRILTARAEDGPLGRSLAFNVSGKLTGTTLAAAQRGTTVSVEDIFFNLPVRRKELEKNVKREYGKVINLLYAYACISVGVRFAVTNQMPKAHKTTVFATKSNTTTRENITNVFGAKTLLALVTLDLNLDMTPSQKSGTQGISEASIHANARSSKVLVQGHISKPVFGEGRQAPDRQMFFVNSRPCHLPQVSKAINDVYKSFNVSQTPFIFANLVMDTNAYDVNVSPDKRTIMLHDQAALLESMKSALTELFEHTDHTVPQSFLPQQKLPGFQPLTMLRRESTSGTVTDSAEHESSSEGDDEGVTANDKPSRDGPVLQHSTESRRNLIHDWVSRDTVPRTNTSSSEVLNSGLSRDKQRLVNTWRQKPGISPTVADVETNMEIPENEAHVENNDVPAEPVALDSSRLIELQPGQTKNFPAAPISDQSQIRTGENSAVASRNGALHAAQDLDSLRSAFDDAFLQHGYESETAAAHQTPSQAQLMETEQEEPIAAITPGSQKFAPGPVQNAFDRMRPIRVPMQTAEITVGDVTTTTIIGGNPPYKKRRIHKPEKSQAVAMDGAGPSLALGLRETFAAPGSQLRLDSSGSSSSQVRSLSSDTSSSDEESGDEIRPTESLMPGHMPPSPQATTSHGALISNDPGDRSPVSANEEDVNSEAEDDEYIDENDKKAREEEKVAMLIREAEEAAARPSESNLKRAASVLKNVGDRKDSVRTLTKSVCTTLAQIEQSASVFSSDRDTSATHEVVGVTGEGFSDEQAESRLSLTVTKPDFQRMVIIGQFNLGFIIAVRPAENARDDEELFIIDQHAADEKYNYERLQRTASLQSQRLVRPKALELTATQEEIILNHAGALRANGFEVESTTSLTTATVGAEDEALGTRRNFRLLTLPMSREKTFDLSDLEELVHLLSEQPTGSSEIPRPKKVQKLLAMRACRSSIMVGKTLTSRQMEQVVRHMGEMEKPWNCPHGRPTMRHLGALKQWRGWRENELVQDDERDACAAQVGGRTDWNAYLEKARK